MKPFLSTYMIAAALLAAATVATYSHQKAPATHTTALSTSSALLDCCADPPLCGAPGEPECWPPLPPASSSN